MDQDDPVETAAILWRLLCTDFLQYLNKAGTIISSTGCKAHLLGENAMGCGSKCVQDPKAYTKENMSIKLRIIDYEVASTFKYVPCVVCSGRDVDHHT